MERFSGVHRSIAPGKAIRGVSHPGVTRHNRLCHYRIRVRQPAVACTEKSPCNFLVSSGPFMASGGCMADGYVPSLPVQRWWRLHRAGLGCRVSCRCCLVTASWCYPGPRPLSGLDSLLIHADTFPNLRTSNNIHGHFRCFTDASCDPWIAVDVLEPPIMDGPPDCSRCPGTANAMDGPPDCSR